MSDKQMTAHERLVSHQPTEELERKASKAAQRGIWTQEDIDLAQRRGKTIAEDLKWK